MFISSNNHSGVNQSRRETNVMQFLK